MYVSGFGGFGGFDGRGVKLVWDALFCVFGGGLGTLPVPHYRQIVTVALQAAWPSENRFPNAGVL